MISAINQPTAGQAEKKRLFHFNQTLINNHSEYNFLTEYHTLKGSCYSSVHNIIFLNKKYFSRICNGYKMNLPNKYTIYFRRDPVLKEMYNEGNHFWIKSKCQWCTPGINVLNMYGVFDMAFLVWSTIQRSTLCSAKYQQLQLLNIYVESKVLARNVFQLRSSWLRAYESLFEGKTTMRAS